MNGPDEDLTSAAAWREVADPNEAGKEQGLCAVYRCHALVMEFRWRRWDTSDWVSPWIPLEPTYAGVTRAARHDCAVRTPEREAVWLDLFLNP